MSGSALSGLKQLAAKHISLRQAFNTDPGRASRFSTKACGITLDYSKNLIDDQSWQALQQLAAQSNINAVLQAMLAGDKINNTEQRTVWHTMLRKTDVTELELDGEDIGAAIADCRARMTALVSQLHQGEYKGYSGKAITDLIWVGIGGSLLGPQMAVEALTPYHCSPVKLHFAGNIDGAVVSDVVKHLDPATTLVFVASKSFGTEETKQNALAVRQWFKDNGADAAAIARHFWATSSNIAAAAEFGIVEQNILPMWDWVGGRYSLWSAVGLPIALVQIARGVDEQAQGLLRSQRRHVVAGLLQAVVVQQVQAHRFTPAQATQRKLRQVLFDALAQRLPHPTACAHDHRQPWIQGQTALVAHDQARPEGMRSGRGTPSATARVARASSIRARAWPATRYR